MSYLYKRGEVRRVARGIYQAVDPASATQQRKRPQGPPRESLLGRVLAYVREAKGKRVRPWQVMNGLGLERSPSRELSKLVKRGLIQRVGPSLYTADPLDEAGPSDEEKPEYVVAEGVVNGY